MTREEAEEICMRQDRCEDCPLNNTIMCIQHCEECEIGGEDERSK